MIRELLLRDLSLWVCVWQSTLFAVIGLVGSFLLRRRPARAYQVLFLAMIAAVLVPTMSVLVKHFELGVFTTEPIALPSVARDMHTGEFVISPSPEIQPEVHEAMTDSTSVERSSKIANIPWRMILLYGWIIATFILLGQLFVAFVSGIYLLWRAQSQACEHIQQAANFAIARFGINKGLQVRSSKNVHSPVIWCWSRPAVLLVPSDLDPRVDWVGVICHELAHWRRWDHISGLIAELVICILPWNPLLWWSKKQMVRLGEQACDDWVIAGGQHCEDYAQSLLDFKPQKQVAFVPAVVHSGRGLGKRIRRILKDNCGNPRIGTIWALAVSIVAACLAAGVAFAQTRPDRPAYRIVHFPKDRSLGKLSTQDSGAVRQIATFFYWGAEPKWEYLCEAKGEVHIPAGKRLSLLANKTAGRDLSPLSKLRPDDLYGLTLQALSTDAGKPSDRCMPHIAHLTELKSLNLGMTSVTDRGLRHIKKLKSLEYLHLPDRATDRGLAYVAELPSLKGLYLVAIGGSQVTDAGLRHLTKLTSLEELYLRGERMGDAGLAHLRDLPRLEYLALYGSHFTDDGCVHLKDIASLKILSFYEEQCRITDAGLVHISNLANLENLSLSVTGPVTDEGIAHLVKMRSLRKLDIGSSQVTDKGLSYLSQIKTLERLDLPQAQKGITDRGLAYLGQLPNLKHLQVSRMHYNDPSMNKEYYTDKGLAELAKCRLLENLSIGSIGITDAGLSDIAKLTNLKELMLFGCENVTDAGMAKLTALKSLRNLYIRHSDVSIAALNHLKPMPNLAKLNVYPIRRDGAILDISCLTALENLNLSFGSYSEKFVDADLKCLAGLKHLRSLQIGPRNFTDKGMTYLAGLTNMERLGIGGSSLTDEGLKHLTNMKNLDHLSIFTGFDASKRDYGSGGNITDKGLGYLGELKMLRFLNIYTDNTFSAAAIQRLRTELPNLFYLRINGEDRLRPTRSVAPLR